jgi:hypothetical protein
MHQQKSQHDILVDIQQAVHARELGGKASPFVIQTQADLVLTDTSVIKFETLDHSVGRGKLPEVGSVVCYKIVLSASTQENLRTYMNIQTGAFVQRLYGTLEVEGNIYAVMEDLDDSQTLNEACKNKTLPTALSTRLDLAYNIAKTMAWYHRAELLLKSVTDHTVTLKELPSGRIVPFLTRLENVRQVSFVKVC